MKKYLLLPYFLVAVLWFIPVLAQAQTIPFYISVNRVYAIEDFWYTTFDDTSGYILKFGYSITNSVALELEMVRLSPFKGERGSIGDRQELDVSTIIPNAKISFMSDINKLRPFITTGFGIMIVDTNIIMASGCCGTVHYNKTLENLCFKAGCGLDLIATEKITINFEISRTLGFDSLSKIKYTSYSLGIAHKF